MPKVATIQIARFLSLSQIEDPEQYNLYLKHKKAVKALLVGKKNGIYTITITKHLLGLYFTYQISENIYTPAFAG